MATPVDLLVVEDNAADVELILSELRRRSFAPTVRVARDEAEYLECLRLPPDAILADYSVRGLGGVRALELVEEQGLDVPLIMLSDSNSDELGVECLKAGASDFLLKDRLARLGQALDHAIEQACLRRALREAQERFRSAFNGAAAGVALFDVEGSLLVVNPALCKLLGRSRDELVDTSVDTLVYAEDRTVLWAAMNELLSRAITVHQVEQRMTHINGRAVWTLWGLSLIWSDDNEPLYFVAQIQDVSEHKRSEDKLRRLAERDFMTGLFARRRFEEELTRKIAHASRYRSGGAILVLDLDNLKHINDSFGHIAGDEMIIMTANALRGSLRKSDVLARLGGDEFAVLLPNAGREQAEAVALNLLEVIGKQRVEIEGQPLGIGVSVGVALIEDEQATSEDLLVYADEAMYEAKQEGGNRHVVSTPERRRTPADTRSVWEQRTRRALESNRFMLYWQPIVDLSNNQISQYEILLRMLDDNGAIVLPGAFLPIAERSGMAMEIDHWVVHNTIRLMADAAKAGNDLRVEVNISGRSIGDSEITDLIEHEMGEAQLKPGNLILEITETAAMSNMAQARQFVRRLTELGCHFALDDFGAGFSSFQHLKYLPVDYIKINGGFIRDLHRSQEDRLVVQSISEVAHGLGKKTIAGFVETPETRNLLRRYKVDYIQGHLVGKPTPAGAHNGDDPLRRE